MKKRIKRPLLVIGALSIAGFVALNVLAYRHAYAMMHFTSETARTANPETLLLSRKLRVLFSGVNIPRPQATISPADLAPACRAISIHCTNGITLGAWYCSGSVLNPLIILFHGYASEKSSTVAEAKVFLELGLSVLLVDFRGSGESSESYTTVGFHEAEDVAAAVRYTRQQLPHSKLILYGQSMGGAAILRSVHTCGVRPDGIIVEAVFDNMLNTVKHRFEAMGVPSFPSAQLLVFWGGRQAGFNGFKHKPVEYAARVECPILFMHGTADSRAHIEEGRRVFAAVHGRKWFREFPGLGHAAAVVSFPEEWKESVGQFLKDQ